MRSLFLGGLVMLTSSEKKALRFYIGDVSGDHPFYSDPKAYIMLNSLFFPGIVSESARAAEGKKLNPHILADLPRLMDFFSVLLSAFRKETVRDKITVYRVERLSDYLLCHERGATVSLTSTSKAGFLNNYRDRHGIVLMRFTLTPGVPCINVSETLDYYAKPEEAEILLPPFLETELTEIELTPDEMNITDSLNEPPQKSVIALPKGISDAYPETHELSTEGAAAGQRVCLALNSEESPRPEDIQLYSQWKSALQQELSRML